MSAENITRNLEQQILVGKSKVLEGHTDWLRSVFVKDNLIISGSCDKTIKIWDINTGICLKTLEGHKDRVWTVFVKDNLIISGGCDNTIKIWDIDSGICLNTLEGHTKSVLSVYLVKDNLIINGSDDKTIRITPISLFPGELHLVKSIISKYNIPWIIKCEVMKYYR